MIISVFIHSFFKDSQKKLIGVRQGARLNHISVGAGKLL